MYLTIVVSWPDIWWENIEAGPQPSVAKVVWDLRVVLRAVGYDLRHEGRSGVYLLGPVGNAHLLMSLFDLSGRAHGIERGSVLEPYKPPRPFGSSISSLMPFDFLNVFAGGRSIADSVEEASFSMMERFARVTSIAKETSGTSF